MSSSPSAPLLSPEGWSPEVYARLMSALSSASPGEDFAAFDFDNTCIWGDLGDACYDGLVARMALSWDSPQLWALLEPEDDPQGLRARVARAQAAPPERRWQDDDFLAYMGHMGRLYRDHDARHGHDHAYRWVVQVMAGMTPERVLQIAREVYQEHLTWPLSSIELTDPRSGERWSMLRGVRVCAQIVELMQAMRALQIEVWIVTASCELWIQPMAQACFGVEPAQVVGNVLLPQADGRLSAQLLEPVTYRQGKPPRALARRGSSRLPHMALGDAMTDLELLESAALPVVLDRGQLQLRQIARSRGWAIQPRSSLTFTSSCAAR